MWLLNDKLNTWAGTEGIDYTDAEVGIAHCFKWLVPKLMYGQCEIHTGMNANKGQAFARVWYGFHTHYEEYAETPALALCLAIKNLITEEKKQ